MPPTQPPIPTDPFGALAALPAVVARMESLMMQMQVRLDRAEAEKPLKRKELLDYLGVSNNQLLEYRRRGLPTYGSREYLIAFKGEVDEWLKSGHVNRHTR